MHSRAAVSVEIKMATMQHKIFYVREFIKTESATAVQRAFRLRFNIQPPTRRSFCRWNHQFEQIGCLCKGKASTDHVYQRGTWDEFQRVLSVAHASQPVERAENLEYGNQLSGVCWGAVYWSSHTAYNWYRLFESIFLNHTIYNSQILVVVSCKQYVDMCNMWMLKRIMERVYKLYTNLSALV